MSTIVRAEETGDKLSELEVLSLVATLILAGGESTVHFICFGVKSLRVASCETGTICCCM